MSEKLFTSEPLYVVTRPFGVTPHDGDPAFNGGFLNGPFRDRTAAENACTAAMGTGKFFQAAILTDAEVSEARKTHQEKREREIKKEELIARVCDRARKMFGDSYGNWLTSPNAALGFTPQDVLHNEPEKVDALLDKLEAEGELNGLCGERFGDRRCVLPAEHCDCESHTDGKDRW